VNRISITTAIGWLSLILGLLLTGMAVTGVVAKALGNDGFGSDFTVVALYAVVAWIAVSPLALAMAPRSKVARIGCLLPFFVYGVICILLFYVFKDF
jgi:hypothetical protein